LNIDKIRSLAEDILSACHPNAVRFVKYYLTITQTRWEQVLLLLLLITILNIYPCSEMMDPLFSLSISHSFFI